LSVLPDFAFVLLMSRLIQFEILPTLANF
jgi:hypothetical protein